jgi:hypothetical protein
MTSAANNTPCGATGSRNSGGTETRIVFLLAGTVNLMGCCYQRR